MISLQISGTIRAFRDEVTKVEDIASRFNKRAPDDLLMSVFLDYDNRDYLEVTIDGFAMSSYTTANELGDIIQELSPYVVQPDFFETTVDNEQGYIYVGSETEGITIESEKCLSDIRDLVPKLTDEDRKILIRELLDRHLDN